MHQQRRVTTDSDTTEVSGVRMPQRFTAEFSDDDGGEPDVALTFEVRDGVPECREVTIRATDAGREVKCSGLAGVRIENILEWALRDLDLDAQMREAGGGLPRWFDLAPGRQAVRSSRTARAARKVTITDDLLREVAVIYRDHDGNAPTQAVADHFDKAHRTATLYVKRARDAGHLGPAIHGKAGEQ